MRQSMMSMKNPHATAADDQENLVVEPAEGPGTGDSGDSEGPVPDIPEPEAPEGERN
jgi:hypothetical protein